MKSGSILIQSIDRIAIILGILILINIGTIVFLYISTERLTRINIQNAQRLHEMQKLSQKAMSIKMAVQSMERQIKTKGTSGIVKEIEEVLESIGRRAKTIRPLEEEKRGEFIEKSAFVRMDKVDLNEIVNILYVLENSPVAFRIKDMTMKTTFEDPEKFILELTVGMITK
jgi:hypothetical protein